MCFIVEVSGEKLFIFLFSTSNIFDLLGRVVLPGRTAKEELLDTCKIVAFIVSTIINSVLLSGAL